MKWCGGNPRVLKYSLTLILAYWTISVVLADTRLLPNSGDPTGLICPFGSFRCPEGKCIPSLLVCNYQADCEKAEDEFQSCPPPECESGQITCRQYIWNKTYCIPPHYRCDMTVDCIDGSDESECTYRKCQADDFHCGTKAIDPCIPKEKKCDGYYDCRTGKDEENCPGVSCRLDQHRCAKGHRCIEMSQKCDHKDDCGDNSDEQGCNFPVCHGAQFRCANALCIPGAFRCDGYQECSDGSDELNCTAITCPENKFLCPRGGPTGGYKCIPKSKLCDGKKDCEDNADEESACSKMYCATLGCSYKCQASPTGGSCFCPEGQQLLPDNKTCTDRDECNEWGFCDQLCSNTDGGYSCSCAPGYKAMDKVRCQAENSSSMMLYFASDKAIVRMNKTGGEVNVVVNTTEAYGLDFHYHNNMLFWSDIKTKKIHSQQLIGTPGFVSPDIDLSLPGSWSPVAIAVDWIGNKLYVADSIGQKIDIFELEGKSHAIVLGSNLSSPADIALDPTIGYMFVADGSKVLKANMDGTKSLSIVSEAAYKASGIAVDIITRRVYWCDPLLHYIETVDYDGRKRFSVVRGQQMPSPSRLTLYESRIYWSDGTEQGVMSIDKYDTSSIQSIYRVSDIRDPKVVKALHGLAQPIVNNPCGNNNGGCQHMCVVTNNGPHVGFRCACNIGWRLAQDERNCELVDDFLIYSQKKFIKGRILNPVVEGFSDAMLPVVSSRARFVGLDFDAEDRFIYYSDVLQNVIYRVHRNGTAKEIVLASQNEGVEGLAVDWAAKNLYFIDGRKGTLSILSTRNVTYRRTLLKNLKRPRAVAVHPNKGYVFFSEWDHPANISRALSDGSNLIVFKNLTLGWPNGLSIDFQSDRLYWCDALLVRLQHSNLDGTDVKTVNSRLIRHPFGTVIYNDFMYITDWRLNAIIKLHKLHGGYEETLIKEPHANRVYGVKIYSRREQHVIPNHPCWRNNGGCQKLCFAIYDGTEGNLTAKCGCPYGERLTAQETCEADPDHEPPIEACPNSWDFTCDNQRCIPKSWVCDGDDDCLDNSDENQSCSKK